MLEEHLRFLGKTTLQEVFTQQDIMLVAIRSILLDACSHATTLDGAFDRAQAKISDLRQGRKTQTKTYMSHEAMICLIADAKGQNFDQTKAQWGKWDSVKRQRAEHMIWEDEELFKKARLYDRENNGNGHQHVEVHKADENIILRFTDGRELCLSAKQVVDTDNWLYHRGRHLLTLYPISQPQ